MLLCGRYRAVTDKEDEMAVMIVKYLEQKLKSYSKFSEGWAQFN
jgi:hypothetical protein